MSWFCCGSPNLPSPKNKLDDDKKNADNIEGVFYRSKEFNTSISIKNHIRQNPERIRKDYKMINQFLASEKSKQPKFQLITKQLEKTKAKWQIVAEKLGFDLDAETKAKIPISNQEIP